MPCKCENDPIPYLELKKDLGMDSIFGEVSINDCRECDETWLVYRYQLEGVSRSGRWYALKIEEMLAADTDADGAFALFAAAEEYLAGGSYFEGRIFRTSGAVMNGHRKLSSSEDMILILKEARNFVLIEGNDFSISLWDGPEEAAAEINDLINRIAYGIPLDKTELGILFAPSSPLQELSLTGGWSSEFISLADRYDAASASAQ